MVAPSPVAPKFDLADLTNLHDLLTLVARLAIIWAAAWGGWLVVKVAARRIIAAVDDGDDGTFTAAEKRGHTIAQLLRSVGRIALLVLALLLSLNLFIDITAVIAGVSILGLAVSFGAQSLVKDVIGGFFILMENQFAVGDVIQAAGKGGTVERMTLRVVHLRDLDGSLHIIPNGQIGVVTNQTRGWSRAVVEVGVAYETDLDRALQVFGDEARRLAADPSWSARIEGAPEISGVIELGDSSIVIRTLIRTKPAQHWDVAREFRRRIKRRLELEGIEIPFPQQVVRHIYSDGEAHRRRGAEAD
ncbi:MAG TPA: mechanosensitive ion channel family protein [Gemmatimonadales bacterium]|nr:mechanosensitive ion channel family protein [Gemmatimonadales bacterium]